MYSSYCIKFHLGWQQPSILCSIDNIDFGVSLIFFSLVSPFNKIKRPNIFWINIIGAGQFIRSQTAKWIINQLYAQKRIIEISINSFVMIRNKNVWFSLFGEEFFNQNKTFCLYCFHILCVHMAMNILNTRNGSVQPGIK